MGTIWIFLTCFVIPFGLLSLLAKKNKRCLLTFGIGGLTFFVSQVLLRIPLLTWWQSQASAQVWIINNTYAYVWLTCFSAGLFEETGRLVSFKLLKKTNTFYEAVAFGLGHGGIEAILLVGIPALSAALPLANALPIGSERIAAILVHVTLSIIIFIGVKKGHPLLYWALAILLHGMFNLIPITITYLGGSLFISECALFIVAIGMFVGCYFLMMKERIEDEKVS
ncbi:YhfC family glutamic-type intramembrane protease [Beduini massiliensis]|uniref:YhfC family glutamic-type intramembrane protease n=1 Tax=Beduini massiliensis TaxID=1585974 RepID=UPI00059A8D6E|nr:YhfC family glutamic-type intramembrane protease [Beduini massiliensis]